MLRYIDPYGNTIFNGQQMYPLLEELDRLAEEFSSVEDLPVAEHSLTWEKASRRRKPVLTPCAPEAALILTFIFQHDYRTFA